VKAHSIPRGQQGSCPCGGSLLASYAVDFGGGKLFEICAGCYAAVFGKRPTDALLCMSQRASTAAAREAFRSWMEHLGAVDAAKKLGGSLY